MNSRAPIALFVYRRPAHARLVLDALRANAHAAEHDLIIYSDGPRSPGDEDAVRDVRDLCRELEGFRSVRVVERGRNLGLSGNIIDGVSETIAAYGEVIVLEDDIVPAPVFLDFMQCALDHYRLDERVGAVHAYNYSPEPGFPPSFFLGVAGCWGWATWRRAWERFNPDGAALLSAIRTAGAERAFCIDASYDYVSMLEDQIAGRNDSWAVRWHASMFLAGKLTLVPGRSLVRNTGFDGSGEHCTADGCIAMNELPDAVPSLPAAVAEDLHSRARIAAWLRGERKSTPGIAYRVRSIIRKITGI